MTQPQGNNRQPDTTVNIYINQDRDDGGDLLPSFWAEGHDYILDDFIRAVVIYCLDERVDIPAINLNDTPEQMWQRNVRHDDWVEYRRTPLHEPKSRESFPVTVLDLYTPFRRGTSCAVVDCDQPWASGLPAQVRVDMETKHTVVRMWFCREHSALFPSPSYRVCMIPVGATILLPKLDGDTPDRSTP